MSSQQISVGVTQKGNEWIVDVGEKGDITSHKFTSEETARAFARQNEVRLGLR